MKLTLNSLEKQALRITSSNPLVRAYAKFRYGNSMAIAKKVQKLIDYKGGLDKLNSADRATRERIFSTLSESSFERNTTFAHVNTIDRGISLPAFALMMGRYGNTD